MTPSSPPPSSPSPPPASSGGGGSGLLAAKNRGGLIGALASLALLLIKVVPALFGLLTKGKLLLTLGTMGAYIWALAAGNGLGFGVGIVLLIFIHELGHVWASRRLGLTVHALVFVPLMGAFVSHDRARTAAGTAFVALMGPVFGGAAGLLCFALYAATRHELFLLLAALDLLMNLFNLAPMVPLDGSKIVPLFRDPRRQAALAAQDPYYRVTDAERRALRSAFYATVIVLSIATVISFALLSDARRASDRHEATAAAAAPDVPALD